MAGNDVSFTFALCRAEPCSAALRPDRVTPARARKPSVGSALQRRVVHLRAPVEPSHARLLFDQIAQAERGFGSTPSCRLRYRSGSAGNWAAARGCHARSGDHCRRTMVRRLPPPNRPAAHSSGSGSHTVSDGWCAASSASNAICGARSLSRSARDILRPPTHAGLWRLNQSEQRYAPA